MSALAILALTILALSFPRLGAVRLDRTTVALGGAVAASFASGLSLEEAHELIHWDTIFLLFGMFVLCGYLGEAGFFGWLAHQAAARASSARTLVVALVVASGIASALLVNDTVCLLFAPFVLAVVDKTRLPALPLLLAVGFGANIGGVATYTGTPQTMIIGGLSGIGYVDYALVMLPIAFASLLATAALLIAFFRAELPTGSLSLRDLAAPPVDRKLMLRIAPIFAVSLAGFVAGLPIAAVSLASAAVALLVCGRDPRRILMHVDWPLLVFFASLFVVTGAVARTGLVHHAFESAAWAHPRDARSFGAFAAFIAVASNLVSNVPLVLMAAPLIPGLADPKLAWFVLSLAGTFAGNLTLIGSVANLIVIEAARDRVEVGFWRFLRYGLPVTLVTTALGVAWLLASR